MRQVWKYKIEPNANQSGMFEMELLVPTGGKPLSLAVQDGAVVVYFEVDKKQKLSPFFLYSIGTGWGGLPDQSGLSCDQTYLGSVQQVINGQNFAWHVYY